MSIMFGQVRAVNFGPFEDVTFDLSKPGLTMIEGEMKGVPGCNDNGAGKSFVLECISWASFDRCLRPDYKGDDVVRNGSKGGTMVEVNVIGDVKAMWRKYRGHPVHKDKLVLFVDGKDVTAGTNPQTQMQVERLLGYDFTGFITTTAFGAREDVKSFFAASDTDRKRLLDSILRLDRFDAALVTATAKHRAESQKLVEIGNALSSDNARAQELRVMASQMGTAEFDETALKGLRVRHKLILRDLDTASVNAEEARTLRADAQAAHSTAMKKHQDAIMSASRARSTAERAKGAADATVTAIAGQIVQAEKKLAGIDAQVGQPCGECGQTMTKACLAGARAAQAATIKELMATLNAKKAEAAAIKIPDMAVVSNPPSDAKVQEAVAYAAACDERESVFASQADTLTYEIKAMEAKQKQANDLKDRLAALEKKVADREAERAEVQESLAVLSFWVEGFGKSGLKSFMLESELASINLLATKYAQRLLGFGAKITLSATRKLKTKDTVKEELTVDAVIPGCSLRYAGASKGQKRRLDLALLLALREVATIRAGVKVAQFFADEVFDGVDKAGCETVGMLLKELSVLYPITLITHTNGLKSIATRVLRVVHTGKSASLVAG